jgi:amino acid transporter
MRSWTLPLTLLGIALVLFAVPSRYEGAVLIPISPGHGLSLVDLAAVVPLIVALVMVGLMLTRSRKRLEHAIQQAPWTAAAALFVGGAGLGLLFASVFPLFWWWAIGAAAITAILVLAVLVSAGRVGASGPEAGGERALDGDGSGDP